MIPTRQELTAMLAPYVRERRGHELASVVDDLLFLFDLPHEFPGEYKADAVTLEREAKRIEKAAQGIASIAQWKLDSDTRKGAVTLKQLAAQLRAEASKLANRRADETKETDFNAHEIASWTLDAIERLSGKRPSRRNPDAQSLCEIVFDRFGVTTSSERDAEFYLRAAITRRLKGQPLTKAKLAG